MPKISVIVAVYDMVRAARRTLTSLSPRYQENVAADDYEVLVVENPSPSCLQPAEVSAFGPNFHYERATQPSPSPAAIMNEAARRARGDIVLLLIDGARLLSPGVLRNVMDATRLHQRPIVAFHSFHLGSELQQIAVPEGRYSEAIEDRLVEAANWPASGYNLFSTCVFSISSGTGWFSPMAESNCLALPKASFLKIGGFDERFQSPGGGLVNPAFYERALRLPDHQLFHVLGEGSFHQIHGGVSTNAAGRAPEAFHEEFSRLFSRRFTLPESPEPRYLGSVKPPAIKMLGISARQRQLRKQTHEPASVARQVDQLLTNEQTALSDGAINRPILFIHGMHRSGTSALARGFSELGFEVPAPAVGRSASNPEGHFESIPIVMLNERLLRALGSTWHSTTALPDRWPFRKAIPPYVQAIRLFLIEKGAISAIESVGSSLASIMIKDPRLGRVWPVWREALSPFRGAVHHLVIVRSPNAVARSLQQRDGIPQSHGLLLWARYACDLFRHLGSIPFGLVRYEALLGPDRQAELAQAFRAADLTEMEDQVDRVASVFEAAQVSEVTGGDTWFEAAYGQLMQPASRAMALESLEERLNAAARTHGDYLRALESQHIV